MVAGIMMTAMRNSMDGAHGLAGWQWVFIIGIPIPEAHIIGIPIPEAHRPEIKLTGDRW